MLMLALALLGLALAATPLKTAFPAHVLQDVAARNAALTAEFEHWCTGATTALQGEVDALRAQHEEASGRVAAASAQRQDFADQRAQDARDALPKSTDSNAGLEAATAAMAKSFSPAQRGVEKASIAASMEHSAAQADLHDAEALGRALQTVLGSANRACRGARELGKHVLATLAASKRGSRRVQLNEQRARLLRAARAGASIADAHHLDRTFEGKAAGARGKLALGQGTPSLSGAIAALRTRKEGLERQIAGCRDLEKHRASVREAKQTAEDAVRAAGAEHAARAETLGGRLAELQRLDALATDLASGAAAIFAKEQELYATEALGVASSADAAPLDEEHSSWIDWRDSLADGFQRVRFFTGQRIKQLDASAQTSEYLRPDKSPHLQNPKTEAPEGSDCPGEDVLTKRVKEVEEDIRKLSS